MLYSETQSGIIKKLFYLALILLILDISSIYLFKGVFSIDYTHIVRRLTDLILYLVSPVVLWYLVGEFSKDKKAALIAIVTTLISALTIRFAGEFFNYYIRIFILASPFLTFGIAHHKSAKGLLYLIPFFIFQGLSLGNLHLIFNFINQYFFNYRPVNLFTINIASGDGSGFATSIFIVPALLNYCILILKYLILYVFYIHVKQ